MPTSRSTGTTRIRLLQIKWLTLEVLLEAQIQPTIATDQCQNNSQHRTHGSADESWRPYFT